MSRKIVVSNQGEQLAADDFTQAAQLLVTAIGLRPTVYIPLDIPLSAEVRSTAEGGVVELRSNNRVACLPRQSRQQTGLRAHTLERGFVSFAVHVEDHDSTFIHDGIMWVNTKQAMPRMAVLHAEVLPQHGYSELVTAKHLEDIYDLTHYVIERALDGEIDSRTGYSQRSQAHHDFQQILIDNGLDSI